MKKFFIGLALFVLVFANAAIATDITVVFTVTWEEVDDYDVSPTCTLYDSNWDPVTSLPVICQDQGHTLYSVTFEDPSSSCENFGITWDEGVDILWDPEPDPDLRGGDIWNGIEAETTAEPAE